MATCTQCGAELKPGTKFCENCGAKVSVPQPAAQPAAVPQPPVQPTQAAPAPPQPQNAANPYPGCTCAPAACTDAPAAAGRRRQSLCRRRTCRPTAPDERSESLRRQCARHTAADRRRRTALRQKHTPACVHTAGCSPCCHAAATRRHGRQPLRQCSPRRQAQAPPRTNDPQADDPDRHPGDIPAYDHRNND